MLLLELRGHDGQQLVLALEHRSGIERRDLTDAEIVVGDVEFLEVGKAQILGRLVARARGGKEQVAQLLERDVGHGGVALRARGGFEHDRVGQDRARHQTRHVRRRHDAVLLIHVGNNGRRAADGLVAHADGLCGLNIGQTVVVDDLEDLGLLQTGHGLRQLVVVDEYDALAPRTQQVIA